MWHARLKVDGRYGRRESCNGRQPQPTTDNHCTCLLRIGSCVETIQNLPLTFRRVLLFLKTIWNHPMVIVIPRHVIYIGIMRRLERPTTKPMYHHQQTNHHNHINIILPQHQPPPLLWWNIAWQNYSSWRVVGPNHFGIPIPTIPPSTAKVLVVGLVGSNITTNPTSQRPQCPYPNYYESSFMYGWFLYRIKYYYSPPIDRPISMSIDIGRPWRIVQIQRRRQQRPIVAVIEIVYYPYCIGTPIIPSSPLRWPIVQRLVVVVVLQNRSKRSIPWIIHPVLPGWNTVWSITS